MVWSLDGPSIRELRPKVRHNSKSDLHLDLYQHLLRHFSHQTADGNPWEYSSSRYNAIISPSLPLAGKASGIPTDTVWIVL